MQDEKCRFSAANVGANDTGFVDVKSKSEADLQSAVATVGPISVAIDASHLSFQVCEAGGEVGAGEGVKEVGEEGGRGRR